MPKIIRLQLSCDLNEANSNLLINNFDPIKDSFFITGDGKCFGQWNINDAVELVCKTDLEEYCKLNPALKLNISQIGPTLAEAELRER
jgi:hypothetical protein